MKDLTDQMERDLSVRFEDDQLCGSVKIQYSGDVVISYRFVCENPIIFDASGCSWCEPCQQAEQDREAAADSAASAREERYAHGD